MELSRVVPVGTTVVLAGKKWRVGELTLADYAELQEWADSLIPSPYDRHAFELANMPRGIEWKRLLAKVLDDQEDHHADLDELLWTDEGMIRVLHLSLRRYHPDFSPDAAKDLVTEAKRYPATFSTEYARFFRLAWGTDPLDCLRVMIDGPRDDGESEPADWSKIYYNYISECKNGPAFGDLTLSQLRVWLRRGETDADGNRPDFREIAEKRRKFWAEI